MYAEIGIKIFLEGNQLRWQIKGMLLSKHGAISLSIVRHVLYGKQTDIFKQPSNKDTHENVCFSLATDDYTIDLECSSQYERDVLSRGFTLLVAHLGGTLRYT